MAIFKNLRISIAYLMVLLAFGLYAIPRSDASDLKENMRDAASASSALFEYVWQPKKFLDKSNEKKISNLLRRLSADFHSTRMDAPIGMFEPGFMVTLNSHEQVLKDALRRFEGGSKDYAMWRLRGLTANCVSCHTRYDVTVDFHGEAPKDIGDSFTAKFAQAEFLMATRQFDKSSNKFLELAKSAPDSPVGYREAFSALKMWLVIEVRVKNRPAEAAREIKSIVKKMGFDSRHRSIIESWIDDLTQLANYTKKDENPIDRAKQLLNPLFSISSVESQEKLLPSTLRATALLHAALLTKMDTKDHQRALYLLSLAYNAIPIESFDVFRELYLEQCIRQHPQTTEAQQCYAMYQDYTEFMNSGSGGLHLEEEDQKKLQDLRRLAFGNPQLTIPDTFRFE